MTTALSDATRGLGGCFAFLMLVVGYISAPIGGLAALYFQRNGTELLGGLFFGIAFYYVFLPGAFCILCGHLLLRWSTPPITTADTIPRNSSPGGSPFERAGAHEQFAKEEATSSEIVEGQAKSHDSAS